MINRLRDCRGGKDYDSRFGKRMRGEGEYADLLSRRFWLFYNKLGFGDTPPLDCGQFHVPGGGLQGELF